jgi:ribosomal protein L35
MKTNKSYTKRIRVTKNKKLVARKPGHDHFNAKERGRTKTVKKLGQILTVSNSIRARFLSTISK